MNQAMRVMTWLRIKSSSEWTAVVKSDLVTSAEVRRLEFLEGGEDADGGELAR